MQLESWRRAVAVAASVLSIAACADEFAVDPPDGFLATLNAPDWPDELIVGDTVTLRAEVRDETTGARVDPHGIAWSVSPASALQVITSGGDSIRFRVAGIGAIQLGASLDDPAFDTASVRATLQGVLFGIDVQPLAGDTLRSLGDTAHVQVVASDRHGQPFAATGFAWTLHGGAVTPTGSQTTAELRVVASANGSSWLVASHAQCRSGGLCRDSVIVAVRQRAATVALAADSIRLGALTASSVVSATLRDANGQPLAGTGGIVWESSSSAVTVAANPADSSQATITATGNGTAVVRVHAGGAQDSMLVRVAQRATDIVGVDGQDQSGTVGAQLADSLRVEVRDSLGHPVAGVTVGWSASGGGSIAGASTTGADGRSAAAWTLGTTTGAHSARAFLAGVDTTTFSATAAPGAVAQVRVSPDTVTLAAIGAEDTLSAETRDAFGNVLGGTLTWTSLTPAIAGVSAAGVVTALANGNALVEVRAGTARDTAVVQVAQVPASVALSVDSVRLDAVGASASLTATVRDARGVIIGAPTGLQWETTSSAVATIGPNPSDPTHATVTAAGNGSTFARVQVNGLTDQAVVVVQQVVTSAAIVAGANQTGAVGTALPDSLRVEALDALGVHVAGASVAWTVMSGGGSVSGRSTTGADGRAAVRWTLGAVTGTQQVRAIVGGTDTLFITATATAGAAARITLTPVAATLNFIGDTTQLAAAVEDAFGNALPAVVAWSSTDAGVATVSGTGIVTAVGNGTAQVVAQSGLLADTTTITVQQIVASIDVSPAADTLVAGDTLRLIASARDSLGTTVDGSSITWSSTDTLVATVDAGGKVTARARGVASIRASANAISGSAAIAVAAWALSFDGNDLAEVPNSPGIEGDSIFTVEVWVRPDSTNGGALLAVWGTNRQTSAWALQLNGLVPRLLIHGPSGSAVDTLSGAAPLLEDVWQHVAFVYDLGNVTLYVNGTAVAADTGFLRPNQDGTPALLFGADASGAGGVAANFLSGDLDEVRIWSVARTAAQIAADMSVSVAGQPGLSAYWPLSEGAGNPVDRVGGRIATRGGALDASAQPLWIMDGSPAP